MQTNNACNVSAPALKSDGKSTRPDCLPEGTLLQLDPALDLGKLKLKPGEQAVATALQRYGGYIMDVAGTPLSVSFELDTTATPGTLGETTKAGFRWDYDAMENVPWEKLEGVGVTPPIRTLVLIDAFRMGGAETCWRR